MDSRVIPPTRGPPAPCKQARRGSKSPDLENFPFAWKFPSNGTGIFLAPKTRTGSSCTIYKILVKFSLFLDMKPGTSDLNKWYRKFRSFR